WIESSSAGFLGQAQFIRPLARRSSMVGIAVRLSRAVSLTPSSVDLLPIAIAPVLRRRAMALPAVRADAQMHAFVPWERRKEQPFRAFGAAFMRLLPDHSAYEKEHGLR